MFRMESAIRIAVGAPTGLLAPKNNSNMGDSLEFLNTLRVGVIRKNTDSRRSL